LILSEFASSPIFFNPVKIKKYHQSKIQ